MNNSNCPSIHPSTACSQLIDSYNATNDRVAKVSPTLQNSSFMNILFLDVSSNLVKEMLIWKSVAIADAYLLFKASPCMFLCQCTPIKSNRKIWILNLFYMKFTPPIGFLSWVYSVLTHFTFLGSQPMKNSKLGGLW